VKRNVAFLPEMARELINIGPGEEFVTINELARTIADLLHFDLHPEYMPDRLQEVKLPTCSADKARKMLGYKTQYTLRQGLQEIINYIQRRGPRKFRYHLDIEIDNARTPKTWKNRMF
jgi:UDP-glucose 4-epimerase